MNTKDYCSNIKDVKKNCMCVRKWPGDRLCSWFGICHNVFCSSLNASQSCCSASPENSSDWLAQKQYFESRKGLLKSAISFILVKVPMLVGVKTIGSVGPANELGTLIVRAKNLPHLPLDDIAPHAHDDGGTNDDIYVSPILEAYTLTINTLIWILPSYWMVSIFMFGNIISNLEELYN